jgi:hypothetical protein
MGIVSRSARVRESIGREKTASTAGSGAPDDKRRTVLANTLGPLSAQPHRVGAGGLRWRERARPRPVKHGPGPAATGCGPPGPSSGQAGIIMAIRWTPTPAPMLVALSVLPLPQV